jgi:hypothetical protein
LLQDFGTAIVSTLGRSQNHPASRFTFREFKRRLLRLRVSVVVRGAARHGR